MMQFSCPFCRRMPTVKTLSRYNRLAVTLYGLQGALDDRGFFYAWCLDCGFAKRVYERTACTEEAIPPVVDFRCEECQPPPLPVVAPVPRPRREHPHPRASALGNALGNSSWKDLPGVRTVRCPNVDCRARIIKVCPRFWLKKNWTDRL